MTPDRYERYAEEPDTVQCEGCLGWGTEDEAVAGVTGRLLCPSCAEMEEGWPG